MRPAWNPNGPLTAWTVHDGPDVDRSPPARKWGIGIGVAWIGLVVAMCSMGCPCIENGTCTEPMAVTVAGAAIGALVVPAVVGVLMNRRWGAWISATAAAPGFVGAGWEMGHAPMIGSLQLASFAVLFGASVLLAVSHHRYVTAARRAFAGGQPGVLPARSTPPIADTLPESVDFAERAPQPTSSV